MTRPTPPRRRLPDWVERLDALVRERLPQPFAWGTHDCCTWAADAVQAVTGDDPMAAWRGSYASQEAAEAVIGPGGLSAHVAHVMALYGAPECPPRLAQRGDVVMVEVGNETLCGVVVGTSVLITGTERMCRVPMRRVVRAWAV